MNGRYSETAEVIELDSGRFFDSVICLIYAETMHRPTKIDALEKFLQAEQ